MYAQAPPLVKKPAETIAHKDKKANGQPSKPREDLLDTDEDASSSEEDEQAARVKPDERIVATVSKASHGMFWHCMVPYPLAPPCLCVQPECVLNKVTTQSTKQAATKKSTSKGILRGLLPVHKVATTIHECMDSKGARRDIRISHSIPKRHCGASDYANPDLVEEENKPITFFSWQAFELGDGTNIHMEELEAEATRAIKEQLETNCQNNKMVIMQIIQRVFQERMAIRKYVVQGRQGIGVTRPVYRAMETRWICADTDFTIRNQMKLWRSKTSSRNLQLPTVGEQTIVYCLWRRK